MRETPKLVPSLLRSLILLALLALASPARADLASEAELVAKVWRAQTGKAERLSPQFLEYGRTKAISLPKSASEKQGLCTSVAFLTERSTDFIVRMDPALRPKQKPLAGEASRSNAGMVQLVRCGEERASLAQLFVELRVARGALEIVVAEGEARAVPIASILPERAPGLLAPLPDAGPSPRLEALDLRLRRAAERAGRAGASKIAPSSLNADYDGVGFDVLRLEEGCHRVELFAEQVGEAHVDIDAEARDAATERLLARDRSDSPDARLEFCLGAPSAIQLSFMGSRGSSEVWLTDAVFPIPRGLPAEWGPRVRAGMAAALWRRKVSALETSPESSFLGGSTGTRIPVELSPGGCYLAIISAARGDLRYLSLSAHLDGRTTFDSTAGIYDGTALAFCAENDRRALLEVDARGLSIAWVLGLWRVGSVIVGEER